MSTDKLSRKEIREPDPFVRVTSAYWTKLVENQKFVAVGLLVFLVALVVIGLVARSSQNRARESGAALSRALVLTRRSIAGSLEPGQDSAAEKFPSQRAKSEELAKQLEFVRSQYPGSDAARTAAVFLGDAQLQQGKLDAAQKSYEEYLASAPPGEPLRVVALEGLGYVFEARKDLDKALDSFDRMSREAAGDPAKAQAAFQRARVLELQGKKPEAAAAFQKVKEDFKETAAARNAGERLALLGAQGVAIPAPEKKPEAKADPAPNPSSAARAKQ